MVYPPPCGNLIRALVNILQAAQTSAGVLAPANQYVVILQPDPQPASNQICGNVGKH